MCVCVCSYKFWPCYINLLISYAPFCYWPLPLPRPPLANWHENFHTHTHTHTLLHAKFQPPRAKTVAAKGRGIFVDQQTELLVTDKNSRCLCLNKDCLWVRDDASLCAAALRQWVICFCSFTGTNRVTVLVTWSLPISVRVSQFNFDFYLIKKSLIMTL